MEKQQRAKKLDAHVLVDLEACGLRAHLREVNREVSDDKNGARLVRQEIARAYAANGQAQLPDAFAAQRWLVNEPGSIVQVGGVVDLVDEAGEVLASVGPRIETLAGVTRTPYNQYESVILPLKAYLEAQGVQFETGRTVTDIDFAPGEALTATTLTSRIAPANAVSTTPAVVPIGPSTSSVPACLMTLMKRFHVATMPFTTPSCGCRFFSERAMAGIAS